MNNKFVKLALVFIFAAFPVFAQNPSFTQEQISQGMKKGEFIAYFQPVYSLYNGKIKEAETLSRWYKDGKIINPGDYIPIVEKGPLMKDFDLYMLSLACETVKKIKSKGITPVALGVNFSRSTLSLEGIAEEINSVVESSGIDRSLIGIEITETFDLPSRKNLIKNVRALKEMGFLVYIDDYGSGFNKLSDIYKLRPNILKLDKSLLPANAFFENAVKTQICKLTKTAHGLGMKVICEGVESSEQIRLLKDCGVDEGQGYFFSKQIL